ncbi:hypothetical protein ACH0C8_16205, partial [Acetobacter lovaniensis]|uniref:hypothetical protein n=1 Tax=Acetobacter lovaniensis TaxID=104100 RepID=UPI00376FA4CC
RQRRLSAGTIDYITVGTEPLGGELYAESAEEAYKGINLAEDIRSKHEDCRVIIITSDEYAFDEAG